MTMKDEASGSDSTGPSVLRALVVEDDEFIRLGIARILRGWGTAVLEASRQDEAIALLAEHPDLVLLDVRLAGGGSGVAVAAAAAELRPMPSVIAISGEATAAEAFRLAQSGVQAYVVKPIDPDALVATIEAVLEEPPEVDAQIATQVGRRSYMDVLRRVRRTMLEQALSRTNGNRVQAAKMLDVTRQAVQQMIRDLDIQSQSSSKQSQWR